MNWTISRGPARLLTDKLGDANQRTYEYDPNGRLLSVADPIGATDQRVETYGYSPDNPAQQVRHSFAVNGVESWSETSEWGDDATKGPKGNLVTVTRTGTDPYTLRYEYDALNRLIRANRQGVITENETITYDPLGRRSTMRRDPVALGSETTMTMRYDALNNEPEGETGDDPNQPANRWIVRGPDGHSLAELRDSDPHLLLTDHLGSTEAVTNANGDVQASFDYDSYGKLRKRDEQGSLTSEETDSRQIEKSPYLYTGKRYDPISETSFHQSRDYNPNLRNWVQTDQYLDPFADLGLSLDPMTMDRTMYVAGNPINMVDEDGHDPCPAGGSGCSFDTKSGKCYGRCGSGGASTRGGGSSRGTEPSNRKLPAKYYGSDEDGPFTGQWQKDFGGWCGEYGQEACNAGWAATRGSMRWTMGAFGRHAALQDYGKPNTYRHTLWAAMVAYNLRRGGMSVSRAKSAALAFTEAHEGEEPSVDTVVDRHNNRRGIAIGIAAARSQRFWKPRGFRLEYMVMEEWQRGGLELHDGDGSIRPSGPSNMPVFGCPICRF